MRLGTANIRNHPDMTSHQVAADIHTVVRYTSICGLQEIQPGEDTPVVRYAIPGHWGITGGAAETPIVWNADRWHLTDENQVTWKRPKLSRPENPTPAITTAVFHSRRRKSLPRFAVVNTHLVAGGYNVQRLPDVREQWNREWAMVAVEVQRLIAQNLTVFLVGDFNRGVMPRGRVSVKGGGVLHLDPWLTPDGPPDHIGETQTPGSVYLDSPNHDAHGLNSDHNLHVVTGALRALHG